ncbi:MAG: glycosyltransferase family 4 protein [Candidatus Omnitrophica bacterium]|jgi:glycosyltransferase involved in cell wall biosynthesis|nr:glycosyltransferase family 4 protein [Candidatus Omnitrophota bacterium]MDD5080139.1 glycosyltransferase family 4 protein [Candidatus Omnitrophota bacterium]
MPKKINLLYVITKLEMGGAQRHLLELCRHLDKEKFNVFLFTAAQGVLLEDFLSVNNLNIKRSSNLERSINPLKDIAALFEIFHFIRKNNIQLAHTHSSKAGIIGRIAARLAGVKIVIHTVHGWPFNDFQGYLSSRLFVLMERVCAMFTDKIIAVSQADIAKGLKSRIGRPEKYSLIRYGIDIPAFASRNIGIKQELGIPADDPVVGMIACFKPQKNPLDFIRMAELVRKAHPRARFILTGDGILRPRIEALVNELGLADNVLLTGWRRDVPAILSTLDIFALSSYWEGLPIAVLEAMAASKPVVATDTGGITEVIRDGENGFLVKPGDIAKMAAKVSLLLADRSLRERLAMNASKSLSSAFTTTDMCRNTGNLYSFLIKQAMI